MLHLVARRDRDRDDQGGRQVTHQPAVVVRDPVRHAVDLDEQVGALEGRERPVRVAVDLEPVLVRAEAVDGDRDRVSVDADAVAAGSVLGHRQAVGLAAVAEVHRARHAGARLWPPAARIGVESRPVGGRFGLAQHDCRLQQRDVGVPCGHRLAAHVQAVQPGRVDVAAAQLGALEQGEQEALVRRAAVDDDHRLGERAVQPGERLVAIPSPGDDLGDRRVELGRDDVALGHAGVDAEARPGGQPEQRERSGCADEAALGVLGVDARLDRVPVRRRWLALEPAAGRHVQLQLDEVDAGDGLRHRVLHLEARFDPDEREALLVRLVEELDRARAAVAGAQREPPRGLQRLALLLGLQRRARRLLDHLLVAALAAAVAQADGPGGALPVGDDLHLHVPRGRDQPLEQHRPVAERLQRLSLRAGEGGGQLVGRVDAADAAPAAPGRGLDHQREADVRCLAQRGLGARHGPAAPRRDRDARLLGEPLGLDLVADVAHHRSVGPDEDDAQPLAQVGELGMLRDEAPADPGRVGASGSQRALERRVVEVTGLARAVRILDGARADAHGLVGPAHEHGLALRLGVEGDQPDRLLALPVELADGVDDPHGRLAAVDDREAIEGALHGVRPQPRVAARMGRSASSSSRPAGSTCGTRGGGVYAVDVVEHAGRAALLEQHVDPGDLHRFRDRAGGSLAVRELAEGLERELQVLDVEPGGEGDGHGVSVPLTQVLLGRLAARTRCHRAITTFRPWRTTGATAEGTESAGPGGRWLPPMLRCASTAVVAKAS